MSTSTSTFSVIGLGSMGMGAAKSAVSAGLTTYGFDLNPEAMRSFKEHGGLAPATLLEATKGADVVLLMLVNSNQCDQVLFGAHGIAASLRPNTVIILGSTTSASYAKALNEKLQEMNLRMIDAPVSGGAAKANTGELSIMASGPEQAFVDCGPLFDAISAKLYRVSDTVGGGASVKMINQLLAGVHIAAAAEAMALGVKAGLAPEMLYEIISNSAGSSWMFQNRVPKILSGDYSPNSMVDIFVKDLGIVLDAGKEFKFPLPISASAHQQFLSASAAGHGLEDDSAVIKVYPGITLPEAKSK
ncbi:L-threonate dehydrogenase [Marinomonas mediterranea]|jgi:3-hydroxyisobutyrate dehydrogenase and related beta-hydroxyacid dehydrogenases|uniref:L-threonate dehydrogenase n=1 Tax=Marinomonas mediterranea (strain ATCC 700492 / JCM 21426 / NBRC 103028 / MMB-1) TaxID=717774 RepID=F2JXM2_MARM1|nr:L-threonate dehydrogenase [Marinomonas mediterranea]ADZ93020.1 3-hydroxyisobutyrate dehydrogenase [Marinomonas mediterranea MMB-1]WCN10931.1 NAD-binding protein [Marinomonas mediterranea]WCN14993.1 NAD-binding protein [Marinomonas mediterranea]WCN19037.1 NAD-binding protein [Marinomonas mediterranea MMB-1]